MRESGLTIAPGVAIVLMDVQGRVLLHRRQVGQGWAPISGHLEPGETITDGLHREVTEETALPINNPGFDWFPAHALPQDLLPYARRWLCDALAHHDRPIVC